MRLKKQSDFPITTLAMDISDDESMDSVEIVEEKRPMEESKLFKISRVAGRALLGWPRERLLSQL